jgi:hypothetical protein
MIACALPGELEKYGRMTVGKHGEPHFNTGRYAFFQKERGQKDPECIRGKKKLYRRTGVI